MRRLRHVVAMAVVLLAAGCGSARRGAPVQEPFEARTPQVEQGEHVFMEYCNGCHPGGASGLAPAINNKPLPGFLIRFQVRNGLGAMPAFPEEVISDDELDAIVAYLDALREHD